MLLHLEQLKSMEWEPKSGIALESEPPSLALVDLA
jgi:hypothetical protein